MSNTMDQVRDAVSIARAVFPDGIGFSVSLTPEQGLPKGAPLMIHGCSASIVYTDCSAEDARQHRIVESAAFWGRDDEDALDALIGWLDEQRTVAAE